MNDAIDARSVGSDRSRPTDRSNGGHATKSGDVINSARGAATVFTAKQRIWLLAAFTLVVILRLPLVWAHGRFLDEEGAIFFAFAWHRPLGLALWHPFAGYLNLPANAATLVDARLVRGGVLPLELAPYLTMVVALAFQLLPAVLILTGKARWLANRWAVVAALLFLAISPDTEEVFANVLHIQYHLALCCALILALAIPDTLTERIGYWAILLLAPLCGPGAIVFLPVFVLRSVADRDRERLTQTLVLGTGAALQLLLFFSPSPVRGHLLDPATVSTVMFERLAALPFLGPHLANILGKWLHAAYLRKGIGWWCAVGISMTYFVALAGLALRNRKDSAGWLVLSGLAIAAASFGGGMIDTDARNWFSVGAGERYNFLPLVLLSLALVAMAMRPDRRYRRLCIGLCVVTLFAGVTRYPRPLKELSQGPSWRGEVAAWRRDHNHQLVVWPKTWTVNLSDRDLPCSPPTAGRFKRSDPSYCESSWLAHVAPKSQAPSSSSP